MNEVEFRRLILAELDAVNRLACHLTRSRQESDDCVQDTYVRALRSRETFTLAAHGVRPWLFKILHNVIVGRAIKAKREREVLDDFTHESPPGEPCETAAGDGVIDWDQVDERLKLAVAELPIVYRATFLLSVLEGLKYREIAEVTEVPIGTVTSRLARARSTLAARLSDVAIERRLNAASDRDVPVNGGDVDELTGLVERPIDDVTPMTEPVDEHNLREHLTAFGDHELDAAQAAALWAFVAARPDGGASAARWLAEQQRIGVAGRRALDGGETNATLRARIEAMCCVEEMLAREQKAADAASRATRSSWRVPGLSLAAAAGIAIGLGVAAVAFRAPTAGASIVPVDLVENEGRVHAECSRLPTGEHAATFESIDAPLAALTRAEFGGVDAPDLSAADFAFVGAGPCPATKFSTVHLLYRSSRPNSLAAVSLFVQADAGQFPNLTAGKVSRVSTRGAPFPTLAWRGGRAIYFLVADNDAIASSVLKALHK